MKRKSCALAFMFLFMTAAVLPLFAQESVEIRISAKGIAFTKDKLTVPAGAKVTLVFTNKDTGIPHNVAVYESDARRNIIFQGDVITGRKKITYTFTAPENPGTYFFQCDVHPRAMTGDFIVE